MVDQLLAFSRLDAPAESSAKITSLSQLLPVLVQSFEPLAQKQQITFEYKAAVDKLWVAVETEVLEKVILNLLSNAFKYTPNGGQVSCELSLSDAGQITFSVSDSGIGIDPQYHQQVFERFGRLTPLHHEDVPGAGIGLALVKSLLDACGGQISLQSEAGKGAIFTVSFSRFEPDDNVEQLMDEALHISSDLTLELDGLEVVEQTAQIVDVIDEHRPTLLVIEDNTDMRNYICESLNDSYQCLSAVNGSAGLARAQADIPDLIISDIMMPELDGYSLSKALKEDDKTSHIPVILLTALSDKDSRKKGWQQQADDYLTKPFDVEELKLRIDNLLTLRNMLKQRFGEALFVEQPKVAITELAKGQGLSAKDQTFLDKLENVMAEHYHDHELSVGVLGSHVAMAERQLRRKLKALLNHAPSEYIRVYRLKKAAEKMVAGEQIQLAALNAGFASYSTFIASFKARYGMSPRDYLQQTQAQDNQ
jgi:DNA-binding response OmpR family regulator/two-component sensor histidine kinase